MPTNSLKKAYQKKYYLDNKTGRLSVNKEWRHANKERLAKYKRDKRKRIRDWLAEFKKTLKCERCGFSDYRALQFHHKEDDKEFGIAKGAGIHTITRLKKEIEKCEVLCGNCHLIHHYE